MNYDYAMCRELGDDLEWLRDTYRGLVTPVRSLRELKRFEVFFSWWDEKEAVAEKSVMGQEYDALKLGKAEFVERSPWFPHNPPLPNEKENGGEEEDDKEDNEEEEEEEDVE